MVDEGRAIEFVEGWKAQIAAHKAAVLAADANYDANGAIPLVDRVVLADKSYTASGAVVIATFLTSTSADGDPPVARGVTSAILSDVIASRMEEEGLQVLQTLCDAFKGSRLKEVDLSDNAMGTKGVKACLSVLSGPAASTLEAVSFCNDGLSESTMAEVADLLTGNSGEGGVDGEDEPSICENLKKIHFYNNMSGDKGCEAFARILEGCNRGNLVDVRFSGTRATRVGSQLISNALDGLGEEGVANMERLDLADNTFGPDGARGLSRALGRCSNLAYVNLRDCVLEDEGAGLVCRALWSADAPLEHLDLSGNDLRKDSGRSIADLFEENTGLKVLHVEENELTSLGVKRIADALGAIGSGPGGDCDEEDEREDDVGSEGAVGTVEDAVCEIEEIRLGHNECGSIGAQALIRAYGSGGVGMPNLRSIHLDGNMFPTDDVRALEAAFGDKLEVMEENDDEGDVDDALSDEDADEDDDDVGHKEDADVDALTASIAQGIKIDNLC